MAFTCLCICVLKRHGTLDREHGTLEFTSKVKKWYTRAEKRIKPLSQPLHMPNFLVTRSYLKQKLLLIKGGCIAVIILSTLDVLTGARCISRLCINRLSGGGGTLSQRKACVNTYGMINRQETPPAPLTSTQWKVAVRVAKLTFF